MSEENHTKNALLPIWTKEQVVALNERQRDQMRHPYTCANRADHPFFDGDYGVLVATIYGWICPFCDYHQTWALEIDKEKE